MAVIMSDCMTETASDTDLRVDDVVAVQRRALPRPFAFAASAVALAAFFFAAGAPTPLLVVYQQEWGFPAWVLTLAFSVYSLALLVALLVVGKLSDHLGRRAVIIGALAVELVSMLMFVIAPDIGWVIAARIVQGLATGAATSAFSAALLDLAPDGRKGIAGVFTGVAPTGGLGLGALVGGLTVAASPAAASAILFSALAVVMVAGIAVLRAMPESVTRIPGALRSLVPRVSVPRQARAEYAAYLPVQLAGWMMSAIIMGMLPTILADLFAVRGGLADGVSVFLGPAFAAIAAGSLGRARARVVTILGGVLVIVGMTAMVVAFETAALPLLWIGTVLGGFGFGASFSGGVRIVSPLAAPHERAGLFSAIYLVAYLAFGVPVAIAGVAIGALGLETVVAIYAGIVIAVAAAGLVAQLTIARRDR